MSSQLSDPAATSEITNRCLRHLTSEIEMLEKHLQFTGSIYENFGSIDSGLENESEQWLISLGNQAEQLDAQRKELRRDLSIFLDVSESEATVRRLIESLPEDHVDREPLRQQRERLLEIESSIQKQNRTNSLVIQQTMDLYHRIAMELTDQKPAMPTYSPTGELTSNDGTNFLQTDC